MPDPTAYEHLLDRANVIAVWVTEDGTVHAVVSEKLPEDELDEADIVSHAVDGAETDVHDAQLGRGADAFMPLLATGDEFEAQGDRHRRHRPVEAGVSEIHAASTAATAGPYPAEITDTTRAEWLENTPEGLHVRLSNCHVYAQSGNAEFRDHILQPSPMDGGEDNRDSVGGLIGYVPLEDGVTADVAARDVDDSQIGTGYHKLPDDWPTGVHRDDLGELVGRRVTKTGRTTGLSSASVIGTGASVRVRYPAPVGVITLREQVIAEAFSKGGDSGSPAFTHDGGLVGLVFAGSTQLTAISPITNIETELGVRLMPDESQDHEPERTFEDYVEQLLEEEYGAENVERQYRYPDGRSPDLVAFDDEHDRVLVHELENDSGSLINGSGQVNYYQERAIDEWPEFDRVTGVLVFPEGHIDEDERTYLKRVDVELWEIPIPEDVSIGGV